MKCRYCGRPVKIANPGENARRFFRGSEAYCVDADDYIPEKLEDLHSNYLAEFNVWCVPSGGSRAFWEAQKHEPDTICYRVQGNGKHCQTRVPKADAETGVVACGRHMKDAMEAYRRDQSYILSSQMQVLEKQSDHELQKYLESKKVYGSVQTNYRGSMILIRMIDLVRVFEAYDALLMSYSNPDITGYNFEEEEEDEG